MGIFDKAKEALGEHPDQSDAAIDRAAAEADQRTGGTYGERIDQGADLAKGRLADFTGPDETAPPA